MLFPLPLSRQWILSRLETHNKLEHHKINSRANNDGIPCTHHQTHNNLLFPPHFPGKSKHQPPNLTSSSLLAKPSGICLFCAHSVNISEEDSPTQQQEQPPQQLPEEDSGAEASAQAFGKRRLEEKFAVLNTGIYKCRSCGYKYNESLGDPFSCRSTRCRRLELPSCGAAKSFCESKSVEIAGFAQNQQFGFGTNTLTSGQKAILTYGSLLLFFILFLSGYFLH